MTRVWIVLVGLLVALTGCLERTERITISPDGSARISLTFETDTESELDEGDAIPSLEGGWLVDRSMSRNAEGEERFTLTAEGFFGPEQDLPANYASARDVDPDLFLQFPTTLEIEERRDGTYYHFHRVYTRRPWAHVARAQQIIEENKEQFEGRDFAEFTEGERAQIVTLMARYEMARFETYARQAFDETMPDHPQDSWLAIRRTIVDAAATLDAGRIARIMVAEDGIELDNEALEAEAAAFEEAVIEGVRDVLRRDLGTGPHVVRAFVDRFDRHRLYDEITEDLGDDNFTVLVKLPGTVVAHNGEGVDRDGAVRFTFPGTSVRDLDVEVMVTSRLRR